MFRSTIRHSVSTYVLEHGRNFRAKKLLDDEDDEDANNANNEEEEEGGKKSKRGRGGTSSSAKPISRLEEQLRRLTQAHPLRVKVDLGLEEGSVIMTFAHLSRMKVVSVKVKLLGCASSGGGGVLQSSLLLSHLLGPEDGGMRSPNPANKFQLSEVGYKSGALPQIYAEEVGMLYRWAQLLGGMDFPEMTTATKEEEGDDEDTSLPEVQASSDVSYSRVGEILTAVRDRVEARIALQKQIGQLEKAKQFQVEPDVPEAAARLFPAEMGNGGNSRIRNWTSVDWEQYTALEVTRHLVEAGAVTGEDFLYRIQVKRCSAGTGVALIC